MVSVLEILVFIYSVLIMIGLKSRIVEWILALTIFHVRLPGRHDCQRLVLLIWKLCGWLYLKLVILFIILFEVEIRKPLSKLRISSVI